MFGKNSSDLSLNTSQLASESFQKSQALLASGLDNSNTLKSGSFFGSSSSSQPQESAVVSANPNPNPYLTSAAIAPDFNADGKTDKVWVNTQTGEIIIRLMDGTRIVEQGSLGQFDLSAYDYKIADFNADNKTDFLLRNKAMARTALC